MIESSENIYICRRRSYPGDYFLSMLHYSSSRATAVVGSRATAAVSSRATATVGSWATAAVGNRATAAVVLVVPPFHFPEHITTPLGFTLVSLELLPLDIAQQQYFELLDPETNMGGSLSCVSLEFCPIDIALYTGMLLFFRHLYTTELFKEM